MPDDKLVDYFESTTTQFTVEPAPFFTQNVTTEAVETFTESSFLFTLTLANDLYAGAYIEIHLPPEIALPANKLVVPTGVDLINVVTARTQFDPDAYPVVIKVVDITSSEILSGEKISFKLQNLRTPTTTVTSSSFKVYTKDADDRIVNFVETDLDVTMLRGIAI